jgi:hypothetical protein
VEQGLRAKTLKVKLIFPYRLALIFLIFFWMVASQAEDNAELSFCSQLSQRIF